MSLTLSNLPTGPWPEATPSREAEGDPCLSCLCFSVVLEEKLFVVDSLYL